MIVANDLLKVLSTNLGVPPERVAVYADALSLSGFKDLTPPDALRMLIGLMATSTAEEAPERVRALEALPAVAIATRRVVQGINSEMRLIINTPDLLSMQEHASQLARERELRPAIDRIRRSSSWRDLGLLKRDLLNIWLAQRNIVFKSVVKDIEVQRQERGQPTQVARCAALAATSAV